MKVCVVGVWHLGTVTAACLSADHEVVGLDFDAGVIAALSRGLPPVFEPGLEDLVKKGIAGGRLRFTIDAADALGRAEVVWVTYDTPVDEEDRADVDFVVSRVAALFPHLRDGTLVLISSQVPVGTTRVLEERWALESRGRSVSFGYSPENLRLGAAIKVFTQPDRVVMGLRSSNDAAKVSSLLAPFTDRIEWMSVESAEMTKHALNAFLATSVSFINEIAALCEQVGADAAEVARGLKSEARIGPRAYLSPGAAFAGGTLARDVMFLAQMGAYHRVPTNLLSSVKASNDAHRAWARRRLEQRLERVRGTSVAVWGLTYKPGTDTLRRSSSVELCRWLVQQGARVRVHDPAVRCLPSELNGCVDLVDSAVAAVQGSSALIVATPWPEYRGVAAADVAPAMVRPLVLDASGFTEETLGRHPGIEYLTVGRAVA